MAGVDVEESYFVCVTVANSDESVTKGFRAGERYKARLIKTTELKSSIPSAAESTDHMKRAASLKLWIVERA